MKEAYFVEELLDFVEHLLSMGKLVKVQLYEVTRVQLQLYQVVVLHHLLKSHLLD